MPVGGAALTAQWTLNTFTLTTSAGTGGSVDDPGEGGPFGPYGCGNSVDIVAEPDSGYAFDEWTGDVGTIGNSSLASTTIQMNGDYNIVATFVPSGPPTYTLNFAVTPSYGTATDDLTNGPYVAGTVVDILATVTDPITDAFVYWSSSAGGTFGSYTSADTTFTMPAAAVTLTAHFADREWVYTVYYPNPVETTYWKYTAVGQEWISAITMYSCAGVLMTATSEPKWIPSQAQDANCNKISVQAYTTSGCTVTVAQCNRKASSTAVGVNFPQVDWRAVSDQQLRLRRACAWSNSMNPKNFTNLVYFRAYTHTGGSGAYGYPYSNTEAWSFTKQTDSGGCMTLIGCGLGDSSGTVTAAVSLEDLTLTVNGVSHLFHTYKITFNNGDAEWWDRDGVFPYAPLKVIASDFDDDQTSTLIVSPLLPW